MKTPYPAYCLHRATDQAYCTLREGKKRRVVYFGQFGGEQSLLQYSTLLRSLHFTEATVAAAVAEARSRIPTSVSLPSSLPLTVQRLYNLFQQWAPTHYRLPTGGLSREIDNYRDSFREILDLFGSRPVSTLSRSDLSAVRQRMIDRKLSRKVINQRIGRVVRVFVWGGDEDRGLVPDTVAAAFRLLKPLQPFRSEAAEREPVQAVPAADLAKVLAVAHPVLRDMLRLQLLTGMRPNEVRRLQKGMVQKRGRYLQVAFGAAHKMAYKGKSRICLLGPQACVLVRFWLRLTKDPSDHLFRPQNAPKAKGRVLSSHYSKDAYILAVHRACVKAGVPNFGPNRVRHLAATEIRRQFGLEAAQVVLGHSSYRTTERYAAPVSELAERVAKKRG